MTLIVELKIGRSVIGEARISNIGHPDDGSHPAEDDLRRYVYSVSHNDKLVDKGSLEHRRNDGAWVLVRKVLNEMEGLRA